MKAGDAIPVDDTHLHFGKAQTETEVKLSPLMPGFTSLNGTLSSGDPAPLEAALNVKTRFSRKKPSTSSPRVSSVHTQYRAVG